MILLLRILTTALSLILAARIIPGIEVSGLYPAIIAALILGVLNVIIRPILFILTLPITIVTLGLFSFIINAGLLLFVASFVDGFAIDGFISALLGSVIVSLVSSLVNRFL